MKKFNEEKNGTRAESGAAALEGFYEACSDAVDEDTATNLTDLIADVMHYAHREGYDAKSIVYMAQLHYEEEA